MKKKTLCILCGMLVAIIFALPSRADPIPYIPTPTPTPKITTPVPLRTIPTPIPPGPSGPPIPSPSEAPTTMPAMTCDGVAPININVVSLAIALHQEIQNDLDNYAAYEKDGVYKLCFNISYEGAPSTAGIRANVVFNHSAAKPFLISGLNLKRSSSAATNFDLFTINTNSPVTLIDSEFQGVGALDEAACAAIYGHGHVIKSSNFTNCKIGVKLGDETRPASSITLGPLDDTLISDMNFFHGNDTAIYWRNGAANRFPYNIITMLDDRPQQSILIDNSVETSPGIPIIVPAVTVTKADVGGVLKCEKDRATGRTMRSVHFENIPADINAILYKNSDAKPQTQEHIVTCRPDSNGNCSLDSIPSLTFSDTECKTEGQVWITAVVDSVSPPFTTTLTIPGLLVGGPTLIGAGGTSVDLPSVPENEIEGDNMNGAQEVEIADAAPSGVAMKTGCGGMIVPPSGENTFASSLILWWLIFMAPAVLVVVRIKKRK